LGYRISVFEFLKAVLSSFSILELGRLGPPIRRVLAIDAGARTIKLLLAQSDFGRLRILEEELIDLHAEGLVSADELKVHLQNAIKGWGNPALALVLPQHVSTSQLIDLPPAPESEVRKLIADETVKLSGVSESRIVYDFVRIDSPSANRQQFWVTLCQEGDIRERILRLGVQDEDICEVTTTANALIAAYRAIAPASSKAILVHLGAQSTVVVIVIAGQGAFAGSFQMGGDFFTRSLARLRNIPEEEAETLKRSKDLLQGSNQLPEFAAVVDGWATELKQQLTEWFRSESRAGHQPGDFELIGSGGGFDQPGLVEYLAGNAKLHLAPWPKPSQPDMVAVSKGFEVSLGTALQALGHTTKAVSLLPEDYRLVWRKRLTRQRVELASMALGVFCILLLAIGTWHKVSLLNAKQALLAKVQAAQDAVDENNDLTTELLSEYENIRPVFAGQQNTVDTLKTMGLLQQTRTNRNFWFVLLADQQSYFMQPPAILSTNRPVRTNITSTPWETFGFSPGAFRPNPSSFTNAFRPGYIAELCFPPGDAETVRQRLKELVNELKQQSLFAKVDLLSDDLRRSLADPKVTVPDRYFVLEMDFALKDFVEPAAQKRPTAAGRSREPRRLPRPSWAPVESSSAASTP
jgi:Tfp pilus assembly PilM family ATPase